MDLTQYVPFLAATLIILVIPGPTIITVITQSVYHGRKSSLPLILGVISGDFTAMTLSLLGLGLVLSTSALLFSVFKWAGAGYLVFLGLKSWFGKEKNEKREARREEKNGSQLFRASFLVTVLNPKSIAFFVAFFPQFINPDVSLLSQFLIMGTSFLVLAFLNAAAYSLIAVRIGQFMKEKLIRNTFKRISGGVLVGLGIASLFMKEGS